MRVGEGPTITVNGEPRPHVDGTLATLLRSLGHDPARHGVAVAVNGELVARREWEVHTVRAGDRVEIVGAVQGG
jgi:sulfur carrier protein